MITKEKIEESKKFTANDRCDSCGAQAYVCVSGLAGELMFCGHHYNKIMNDAEGYKKMMSFMISVIDNRSDLEKKPDIDEE
jgi:hypothetical protein